MAVSELPQADLFTVPNFDTLSALLGPNGKTPAIVIGVRDRRYGMGRST
jgi:hypothetical protein